MNEITRRGRTIFSEFAKQPENFLQPLFEFLRRRPEVQAAWVFEEPQEEAAAGRHFVFALLAVDADEQLEQDFVVVAQNARPKGNVLVGAR